MKFIIVIAITVYIIAQSTVQSVSGILIGIYVKVVNYKMQLFFLKVALTKEWPMGTSCVEYIAAGMNALPESDTVTDYTYDDDDDDERSSKEEYNAIEYKVSKVVSCIIIVFF